MSEWQILALFFGVCLFVMALVILGLAMTLYEMKARLNSLWRSRERKLQEPGWSAHYETVDAPAE